MSGSDRKKGWKPKFDYPVDYNDHFETPLVAYEHILPLLEAVSTKGDKSQVLYDPYYCDGRSALYFRQLGFDHVVHAKRDFYRDIADKNVPHHDVLVTNPPYSETHKEKCLEFCAQQFRLMKRPFFLLMPNYVASKNYYRQILGDVIDDVAFVLPCKPYDYDHPEGTGHQIPPFASLWFCGIGRDVIRNIATVDRISKEMQGASFMASLRELKQRKAIPTEKRPNPRQRKKRKVESLMDRQEPTSLKRGSAHGAQNVVAGSKTKKSKYRNISGERTKKRF